MVLPKLPTASVTDETWLLPAVFELSLTEHRPQYASVPNDSVYNVNFSRCYGVQVAFTWELSVHDTLPPLGLLGNMWLYVPHPIKFSCQEWLHYPRQEITKNLILRICIYRPLISPSVCRFLQTILDITGVDLYYVLVSDNGNYWNVFKILTICRMSFIPISSIFWQDTGTSVTLTVH